MLRVLFNSPDPSLEGGPATHLPLLKAALARHVELEPFQHGRRRDDETILRKLVQTLANLASVEWKILRHRPDLIHVNSAFDSRSILRDAPLAFVARRHGIPILLKTHGSFSESIRPRGVLLECAKRILLRNVTALSVLSDVEKTEFEDAYPDLKGRVCVVKNVISESLLQVKRNEAEAPLVLFVSRFLRAKGPFQLLDAVPVVLERFGEVQFVLVGDGPDAAQFDYEVAHRKLARVVKRLPRLPHNRVAEWYTRAWVLVFPTFYPEGMPMVVAEAMATGTPVVTSPTRFSRSYMLEGVHCLLCDPKDSVSIAQQIVTLLRDPALRQRMSDASREFAQQFRQETVVQEFLSLYSRACQAKQVRTRSLSRAVNYSNPNRSDHLL
jgi:glycosyltransferase involved in cell wall biosynthesis